MEKRLLSLSFALAFFVVVANAQSNCDTTSYHGSATYYTGIDDASGTARSGNCTFVNDDIKPYYGAAYTPVYDNSNFCGVCAQVTGQKGTQIIQIVDQCPSCQANGDIDLSPAAFKIIVGDLNIGKGDITWKTVPCPLAGKNIRVVTQGSNEWYAKLIIEQHVNKIKAVDIKNNGNWTSLTRGADNGWTASGIDIPGNTQVRVTDIYNEQVVVDSVEIASGKDKTFTGTSNFKACTITSVEDKNRASHIQIYPNPAYNLIVIADVKDIQTIKVYNSLGELVLTKQINPSGNRLLMNVSTLRKGIYTLQFTTGNNIQAVKKIAKF